ncbi:MULTISPECIES: PAS sensor domain-containing protein [Pseudomonas]|uniref:Putative PAS/PAC sensor protein n=1 Tax=Ectopseudomonas oleovorans TaxID=301 RepID=A0A653BDI3_ECTOL|nr:MULTISPECIES: PAS sensor domain-containing protein [Pseudomonas]TNF15787.1 MAG: PAS sensor domain-containing protein [Pseudomonadales bacterium]CAE6931172.1 Putative PAS/PAC sensor protein [Pseudomonas oleovorans]QFT22562.1 Blue-light photoreceptor [Pseudomonas sp. THAF187a]QFT42749.1 Blue-light photoreceptor [Pseudomonas sp. THAF42]QTS84586.1 PAS sensor domain-containing protein [Pseudomonas khazarica]|tara:strand:+ start:308 stop:754 length:447 start_codon:yes stop_codon:yes gene_type:complete
MINAKLLQLVVDASNDGIVVAEQEGEDNILIYANAAFERLTGYASDDILYQDCRFLQGSDRAQAGLQAIRDAVKAQRPCRQIIRNYRKDGSAFWNELSITPVLNEGDQLTYYIGIQKDVTEQVQAQQRVKELESEVAELKAELARLKS